MRFFDYTLILAIGVMSLLWAAAFFNINDIAHVLTSIGHWIENLL